MRYSDKPMPQGWQEDGQVFYVELSEDYRPAFEQMVAGQPLTDCEWLTLMIYYTKILNQRESVDAQGQPLRELVFESRENFLKRLDAGSEPRQSVTE